MQKQITIRGRTYTLRANEGEELEQAAAEIDQRMRAISARAAFDEYTLALLTALNLAAEGRAMRRQLRGQLEDMDRQFASIEAVLEAALGEVEPEPEEEEG